MKKTIYEVPSTMIIQVRTEGIVMGSITSSPAPTPDNISGWETTEENAENW